MTVSSSCVAVCTQPLFDIWHSLLPKNCQEQVLIKDPEQPPSTILWFLFPVLNKPRQTTEMGPEKTVQGWSYLLCGTSLILSYAANVPPSSTTSSDSWASTKSSLEHPWVCLKPFFYPLERTRLKDAVQRVYLAFIEDSLCDRRVSEREK